jgi:hypothetical protein
MGLGAATVLLGLALSAPVRAPAKAVGAPAAQPAQPPAACTRYRVLAEKNELVPDAEVAAWATAALEKASLLDAASPCFVHLRITAGPIRSGGKEDGFVAHVSASTRRFFRDGKLVTREKGMLFVEAHREEVVPRVRSFVDDFVAGLVTTLAPGAPGGRRGGSDAG